MAGAPATDVVAARPLSRNDLAVAWMNRGHALLLHNDPASLAVALHAYDEAVALLSALPHGQNPAWRNSLAAALMNRGTLLHRRHGTDRAAEALAALAEAAGLLRTLPLERNPWYRRNLAGTLVNRACLLLDLARPAEARAAADEARALTAPAARTDLLDADLALKSRRALCDSLGQLLVAPGADQDALAAAAADVVDDALALVRFWSRGGVAPFRPLTLRLFRFGARLYRVHQPHFLVEFLFEQLGPGPAFDRELRAIALENIDAALSEPPGQPWLTVGEPASERRLGSWRELKAARGRLASPS